MEFNIAAFMTKVMTSDSYTETRADVILLRYKMINLLDRADLAGFDVYHFLGIGAMAEWGLLGMPHWAARRSLNEREKSDNQRTAVKVKIRSPWIEGVAWHKRFCSHLESIIETREDFIGGAESFEFTLDISNSTFPRYRRRVKELKRMWRSRPKRSRPPSEFWARLPELWDDGPLY